MGDNYDVHNRHHVNGCVFEPCFQCDTSQQLEVSPQQLCSRHHFSSSDANNLLYDVLI